jgi:flagellar secretion chaperone FliS
MTQDSRVRQYRHTEVQTADRGKLLLMVYDAAIDSLRESQRLMRGGDMSAKGLQMDRAIRAVGELRSSLDLDKGREIAASLDQLYDFMQRRMREANIQNDPELLEVVARILEDLRETWNQVIRKHASEGVNDAPGSVREIRV